jgi:tetratricopeptide (TPR) repeat protein
MAASASGMQTVSVRVIFMHKRSTTAGVACLTLALSLSSCMPKAHGSVATTVTSAYVPRTYGASEALRVGNFQQALLMASRAVQQQPEDGRARYQRAVALAGLGETDDAVNAFREAESRFSTADLFGRSIAVYGRARAFDQAGRCEDARKTYREYAALVRAADPAGAELALRYARSCRPGVPPHEAPPDLTPVVDALDRGDYAQVLARAEALPRSTWRDLHRGWALTGLGETEQAVNAFDEAARSSASGSLHLRALAMWGKARALRQAADCAHAKRAYESVAELVRPTSPSDAELAAVYARECPGP